MGTTEGAQSVTMAAIEGLMLALTGSVTLTVTTLPSAGSLGAGCHSQPTKENPQVALHLETNVM